MDHFEVLGIRRSAGEGEITAAFRALVKVHHPDHGGDEKRFTRLVLARAAALADAKKAPSARTQASRGATQRHEPEARHSSTTTFHVGPSPFEFPKPGLSDFVSFFNVRL